MRKKAVIIGVGALGIGFLAERMAADYDLCLADISAKTDILNYIRANQGFTVNVCGLQGVIARDVTGAFETTVCDTPEGRSKLDRALGEADLILTATTRKVLDGLTAMIALTVNGGDKKRWLLFCENGLDIAATYAPVFDEQTLLVDTVMSRMCRFADPGESAYRPLWPGDDCTLVVEDYDLLPVDADLCRSGPFSPAFTLVTPSEFLRWEDVKLYMHNGMHAFVSYHAFLAGAKLFSDTPSEIRDRARTVMMEEVVPAIVNTHKGADREELAAYGLNLLERFFNPYFNDSIERGVRGVREKLAPSERLVGGCEYIQRAGIDPKGYADTIQAAKNILALHDR